MSLSAENRTFCLVETGEIGYGTWWAMAKS